MNTLYYTTHSKKLSFRILRGVFVFVIIFSWLYSPIALIIENPFTGKPVAIGPEIKKAEAAFGNGYTFQRTITIDNTKVIGADDLTNFPLLASTTLTDLKGSGDGLGGDVTNANGWDIVFASDSEGASPLAHEIESYSSTTGSLVAWVKIPTLSTSVDTTIYMFYGNSGVTTSQQDIPGVWGDDYAMVQHLSEQAGLHEDSTQYNNDSSAIVLTNRGTTTVDAIGGSGDFDGIDDYIQVEDSEALDIAAWEGGLGSGTGTIEAWIRVDDATSTEERGPATTTAGMPYNYGAGFYPLTAPGTATAGEYSNLDSVVVGDTIYYFSALCNTATAVYSVATTTRDGNPRNTSSVWKVVTTELGGVGAQMCAGDEGLSAGIDSDGTYLYYAILGNNGTNASSTIATSTLNLDSFSTRNGASVSNFNYYAKLPILTGVGAGDSSAIDITLLGDKYYLAAVFNSAGTATSTIGVGNITGFATATAETTDPNFAWHSTFSIPTGAGDEEGCGVGLDSDGFDLYYTTVCNNGGALATWNIATSTAATTTENFTTGPWLSPAGTPNNAFQVPQIGANSAGDHIGADIAVAGGIVHNVAFLHDGVGTGASEPEHYITASTSLNYIDFVSAWATTSASSSLPAAGGDDSADASVESDGYMNYYSAFAHDAGTVGFYVSSSTLNAHPIVTKKGAYELLQVGKGFFFNWAGKPVGFGTSTTEGPFYHVAVVHNGSSTEFYINGDRVRHDVAATSTSYFTDNSNPLFIGYGTSSTQIAKHFNGLIDEVRISNAARSGEWIATQYNNFSDPGSFYQIGNETEAAAADTTAGFSGRLYTDDGFTADTSGGDVVMLAIGTTTAAAGEVAIYKTTTNASGDWFVTVPDRTGIGIGVPMVAWLDGDSQFKANTFFKATSTFTATYATSSGIDLYYNNINILGAATSTENNATSTTIADLSFFDSAGDGAAELDILYSITSRDLVIATSTKLRIAPGAHFAPEYAVTIHANGSDGGSQPDGDLQLVTGTSHGVATSAMMTLGVGGITIGGSFFATSGVTYTTGLASTTFNATTTGKQIYASSTDFWDLTFNGASGGWVFGEAASSTNDFLITAGTVTGPSSNLYIRGNYTNNGTFTNNSGTVVFNGTSTQANTIAGTLTGSSAFYNLQFEGATTTFGADATANNFTISTGTLAIESGGGGSPQEQVVTSGVTLSKPVDWNNANNRIEVIGGGGGSGGGQTNAGGDGAGGAGGGGGGYGAKENYTWGDDPETIQIGTAGSAGAANGDGGAGGQTFFNNATDIAGNGGGLGQGGAGPNTGGAGGTGVGDFTFTGGDGGDGGAAAGADGGGGGGGGGGAAGDTANGNTGTDGPVGVGAVNGSGGAGADGNGSDTGRGTGGIAGSSGGAGGNAVAGTDLGLGTAGTGGGGGGGGGKTGSGAGGAGGEAANYGGGGGGGGGSPDGGTGGAGKAGKAGVIILKWTPAAGGTSDHNGAVVIGPSGGTLTITGDYTNDSQFINNGSTVVFGGTNPQLVSGTLVPPSAFYNVTITNQATTTFTQKASTTNNFVAQTASSSIVFASGATSTLVNFTVDGTAAGTLVNFTSSVVGTPWSLHSTGTQSVQYARFRDSSACDTGTLTVTAGEDGGGNHCFSFAAAAITYLKLFGRLWMDEGFTADTSGSDVVMVAVGTTTAAAGEVAIYKATTDVAGDWNVQVDNAAQVGPGTPILAWLDGDTKYKANTFFKATTTFSGTTQAGFMSGIPLYYNVLNVLGFSTSSEETADRATSTTNTDLSFIDSSGDGAFEGDILYTVSGGALDVATSTKLRVAPGAHFAPGGAVVIHANGSDGGYSPDGDIHLAQGSDWHNVSTSSMMTLGGALTIGGSYFSSSSATLYPAGQTITLNATTTGKSIYAAAADLGVITFNGSGGGWTFQENATTTGTMTITAGTVTGPSSGVLAIGDSYSNAGTFTHNSSVVRLNATDAGNTINAGSSSFGGLEIDGSGGTFSFGTNPATTTSAFKIINGTVTLPSEFLYVGGNFRNSGTMLHNGSSAVFDGSSAQTIGESGNTLQFNHVQFTGTGGVTFGANATTTNLTIASGAALTGPSSGILAVEGNFSNASTFTHNSSLFQIGTTTPSDTDDGSVLLDGGGTTFYNFLLLGFATTSNSASNFTVSNRFDVPTSTMFEIASGHTVTSASTGDIALTGSTTGQGTFSIQNNGLGTGGYLSSRVRFDATNGDILMPGRVYESVVDIYNSGASNRMVTLVASSTVQSALQCYADGAGHTSFDAGSNNANLDIDGNLDFVGSGGGSEFISAGGGSWSISGATVDITDGEFSASTTGTLTLDGTSQTVTFATGTLGHLFASSTATLVGSATTSGSVTIASGGTIVAPHARAGSLYIGGDFTNSGTFTENGGDIYFYGDNTQTFSGTLTGDSSFGTTTFLGVGNKLFSANASTTNMTVAANASTTAPDHGILYISGNYTNNGIFTHNYSTTTFDGISGTQTLAGNMEDTSSNASAFWNVEFERGATKTFGAAASSSNFYIKSGSGTVTAPSGNLTLWGDYRNEANFDANSGTVILGTTTGRQTLSGEMVNYGSVTGAFANLTITNNSGSDGTTSPSVFFGNVASTTGTFTVTTSGVKIQLPGLATSTFTNINWAGTSGAGNEIMFRSTTSGTNYAVVVSGTQTAVSYVDFMDMDACDGELIAAADGTNYNSGNNRCVEFASPTISLAQNEVFQYGAFPTGLSTITITEPASNRTIVSDKDIRIALATSTLNARFDTSVTTPSFGGSASGKVSGTVSYQGGNGGDSVVFIDVTPSDFSPGDTLTVSGLRLLSFLDPLFAAASQVRLWNDGSADQTNDAAVSQTVAIRGTSTLSIHTAGQVDDQFAGKQSLADTVLFRFQLSHGGEGASTTQIVFSLSDVNGIASGDITDATTTVDYDGDGAVDAEDGFMDGAEGSVSISGANGTITFTGAYATSTTMDYLLRADVANLFPGDRMRISLVPGNITLVGTSTLESFTPTTTAVLLSSAFHERSGGGGGGADAAPAGAGVQTGGTPGGGGNEGGSTPGGGGDQSGGGGGGGGGEVKSPFDPARFLASVTNLPFVTLERIFALLGF